MVLMGSSWLRRRRAKTCRKWRVPFVFDVLQTPKGEQRIPELLSRKEVARLLSVCADFKHRVMLTTCYVCGLRVSELMALQVKHIDSDRHLLRIEQARGAKARQVILDEPLLALLRQSWQRYPPIQWLFYGRSPEHSLSISSAQKVFSRAKQRAGIPNPSLTQYAQFRPISCLFWPI